MIKKLISLILAISCFSAIPAFAAETIVGEQKNFDAYTLTNMAECYKYSTEYSMNNSNGYFGNTSGGGVIVYKNMDFGKKGAVNVELTYSNGGNYDGTLQFRKGSPTGEIIAEFKSSNSGSSQTQKTVMNEVEFPTVASGRFDLYVVLSTVTFGNLYSFKFNETPTAYQTIHAINSLKDYIGFADDDFDTGYVYLVFEDYNSINVEQIGLKRVGDGNERTYVRLYADENDSVSSSAKIDESNSSYIEEEYGHRYYGTLSAVSFMYNDVNFAADCNELAMRTAIIYSYAGQTVRIYIDGNKNTGTLVGTFTVPQTTGWTSFSTNYAQLSQTIPAGTHDVCIYFGTEKTTNFLWCGFGYNPDYQ